MSTLARIGAFIVLRALYCVCNCVRTHASVGLFINRLVSGLVASSFLSLVDLLTASGAFMLFGVIALLFLVFVYFWVPETRGKPLEHMSVFLEQWLKTSRVRS